MKYLLIIAMLAVAAPALANNYHDPKQPENTVHRDEIRNARIAADKAHRLQVLNHRISATQQKLSCLQAAQTCISAASDQSALYRCHAGCGGD